MQKLWTSPISVLDLRLCREEGKTKPHSPRAGWLYSCICLDNGARIAGGLSWGLRGSLPGVRKMQSYFSYSFDRNFARTKKLWGKLREIPGHTWVLCSIPFPASSCSFVYIFLPSDGRMRVTLQEVNSEDAWERTYLPIFRSSEEEGAVQPSSGLSSQDWETECRSPPASPTSHPRLYPLDTSYYCCSMNSLPLTETWLSKTQRQVPWLNLTPLSFSQHHDLLPEPTDKKSCEGDIPDVL